MKSKRESGEVVVEASIVVTLVVIVVTAMLYIGMVLYQQTLVSVMANQTAANIAQVYSNNLKDPFSGYVDPERVYQSITYSNMKTDAYMSVVEQKANIFAQYRLKSSRILAKGNTSVEVDIVKKPNELLKSQVVITIKDRYDVPLVGMFGTTGLVEFASSGRADCVDILEYINGVEAIGDPENSNVYFLPDSKNCTVTFVPDNENPMEFKVETVMKGHSILSSSRYTHCVMPATPVKGDLEFAGWYTADGRPFSAADQIDENITVYGKWLCLITMDANGGTVNGKATDTKKVPFGNRATLPEPQRSGYNFLGWFDETGTQYCSNDTPIMINVKLKAKWERRIYTVTFDPNDGALPAGASRTVTVVYNETVTMPTAKRQSYTFEGWYDSNGREYTNSSKITSNVVLYANWKACTSHRSGDCGIDHTVNQWFDSFHGGAYIPTTKVRCIVCVDCGCLLDGNERRVYTGLGYRYNSSEPISWYIWCAEHKLQNGVKARDTYMPRTSAGVYSIH